MLRTVVDSSTIRSVGHDARKSVLEIEFHNGRVYQYLDVPRELYVSLMRAHSKGAFLNESIRDAFAFEQL